LDEIPRRRVLSACGTDFSLADFPAMFFRSAGFWCAQVPSKFSRKVSVRLVLQERYPITVLVPTMLNLLTQMPRQR